MPTIYLIRHGEAEGNLFKRVHGQFDSPVTALGREQISCLQQRFADIAVDAVYSSDLQRAQQTAQAIYLPKMLPLHTLPALREVSFGAWEDVPFGAILQQYPGGMQRFATGDPDCCAPGGERLGDVALRMRGALERIAAAHPNETVAVVTHGTAIRQALTLIMGGGTYLPEGRNTSVSCLEAENGVLTVKWYNDISHLSPALEQRSVRPVRQSLKNPPLFWFRSWDSVCERDYYLACRSEGWLSSHGTMEHFDAQRFLDAVLTHSAYNPDAVRVVMRGDTRAGILELDDETGSADGAGAIAFYYVDAQNRRNGIGVQLLGEAISHYRALGRSVLRLRCAPENHSAYRFYTRNGFYQIGMATDSVVPLRLMERKLD